MASATPSKSVDSELCCSICLDTFVCPSTLSCGHSFCLRCLEAAWETASVGVGMAEAIVCDICSGGQIPAVKTCLRCEMSYCATHARPHLENPRLREHLLVAPIANLEERRCQQHRQRLCYPLLDERI
uniref:RING-type domain-containing protein n=1 Tax=Petromyzon marinus TaxID=7757 RepID=S4RPJ1_PETMA